VTLVFLPANFDFFPPKSQAVGLFSHSLGFFSHGLGFFSHGLALDWDSGDGSNPAG